VVLAIALMIQWGMPSGVETSGAWTYNARLSTTVAVDTIDPALRPWVMPVSYLVIRITHEAAIFYDAGGLRHAYKLLRQTRDRGVPGGAAEAVWDGATLRLERSLASGVHISQAYEFDAPHRRLMVTTVVSSRENHRVARIRHMYDVVR
jgi:hypothetical protein